MKLEFLLKTAGVIQIGIAILNLFLARIMNWKEDLERLPLLIREVFYVHSWFISIILSIFAVMTLRFSAEMVRATNPACLWLAGGIAIFWLFRALLQFGYYNSSHWRGRPVRTRIHMACLLVYGGMGLVYLATALEGGAPK